MGRCGQQARPRTAQRGPWRRGRWGWGCTVPGHALIQVVLQQTSRHRTWLPFFPPFLSSQHANMRGQAPTPRCAREERTTDRCQCRTMCASAGGVRGGWRCACHRRAAAHGRGAGPGHGGLHARRCRAAPPGAAPPYRTRCGRWGGGRGEYSSSCSSRESSGRRSSSRRKSSGGGSRLQASSGSSSSRGGGGGGSSRGSGSAGAAARVP